MSTPASEGFGWPAFYEAADEGRDWIAEQSWMQAYREAWSLHHREQRAFQIQVEDLLGRLRARRLLRDDRLSYTRICQLEWETGQRSGPWSDYWNELREAQLLDEGNQ